MGGGRVSGGLKLQEFSRPKKYMRNNKNTPRYIGHENNGHETMGTTHRARNDGHETTDTEQRTRNNVHERTGKILMAKELPYFDYCNLLFMKYPGVGSALAEACEWRATRSSWCRGVLGEPLGGSPGVPLGDPEG